MLFARLDENKATTRAIPIILVPGIMGTRLRLKGPRRATPRDWSPDDWSVMTKHWGFSFASTMRGYLHHGNPAEILHTGTTHTPEQRARGWACLADTYYGACLRELGNHTLDPALGIECPIYAFGYDWRQNNADSAKRFADFARATMQTEHANALMVITHSMGGFVVRRALLDAPDVSEKVTAVIHVGQPVLGAPVAYRRHLAGAAWKWDGAPMRFLMGTDPDNTFALFSAMPSAMQLLPHDARKEPSVNPVHDVLWMHRRDGTPPAAMPTPPAPKRSNGVRSLYRNYRQPPGLTNWGSRERHGVTPTPRQDMEAEARDLLDAAHDFHTALGSKHRKHVTWTISATGVTTDDRLVAYLPGEEFEGYREMLVEEPEIAAGRNEEGDGTVPLWSATALLPGPSVEISKKVTPGICTQYTAEGVEHDKMCTDPQVIEAIVQILELVLRAPNGVVGAEIRGAPGVLQRIGRCKNPIVAERERESAEIELRVARWLADQRREVYVLEEPEDGDRRADLEVDGQRVDVKAFKLATHALVRGKLREALQFQARWIVIVRMGGASLERKELDEIAADEKQDFEGATIDVIEESELPALGWDIWR